LKKKKREKSEVLNENSAKKIKMSNYYKELQFGEVDDRMLELLMEIVSKENLIGKKCALCIDSVKQDTIFFLAFLNGAGVIALSVEKKTSGFVNAVFYLGMMEQCVDIDVVAVVTDHCRKIGLDSRRFKMNTKTAESIINKNVNIYNDLYHLYKSFCKSVLKGGTEISKEILQFFLQIIMTIKQWPQTLM
jgi:hypothetical protein